MRKGNAASTDTLLSYFGKWSFASLSTRRRINSQDKYVFRRLLKGFASVKNDIWTLKEEWKQWVVCYQNVCPTNHSQALLLHDLLKNTILTEIIGIEGVDDLTAHQLGVESLLAGGEHHLLLHAAVIGSPNGSLRTSSLPGDQQEIGVLSSLLVSVLEIVHNETRLIGWKGIHHLLPGLLSGTLLINRPQLRYLSLLHDHFHSIHLLNVENDISAVLAQSQLVVQQSAFISAHNSGLRDENLHNRVEPWRIHSGWV